MQKCSIISVGQLGQWIYLHFLPDDLKKFLRQQVKRPPPPHSYLRIVLILCSDPVTSFSNQSALTNRATQWSLQETLQSRVPLTQGFPNYSLQDLSDSMLKHRLLRPIPRDSESVGIELGPIIWISNKFPGDAVKQSCWSGDHILRTTALP